MATSLLTADELSALAEGVKDGSIDVEALEHASRLWTVSEDLTGVRYLDD